MKRLEKNSPITFIYMIMLNSAILAMEDIQLSAHEMWEIVRVFWREVPISECERAMMTIRSLVY